MQYLSKECRHYVSSSFKYLLKCTNFQEHNKCGWISGWLAEYGHMARTGNPEDWTCDIHPHTVICARNKKRCGQTSTIKTRWRCSFGWRQEGNINTVHNSVIYKALHFVLFFSLYFVLENISYLSRLISVWKLIIGGLSYFHPNKIFSATRKYQSY